MIPHWVLQGWGSASQDPQLLTRKTQFLAMTDEECEALVHNLLDGEDDLDDSLAEQLLVAEELRSEEDVIACDDMQTEVAPVVVRKKRRYDRQRARATRARNRELKRNGLPVPPAYEPKRGYGKKRGYQPSGKYVCATLKKGGKPRRFAQDKLDRYRRCASKYISEDDLRAIDGTTA